MGSIKISSRIRAIADMVSGVRVIADIGSDHAYLPIFLLIENKIKRAIVIDIAKGPILTAKKNIEKYCCEEACSIRLGSGLEPLKIGESECIVIAGMGGNLIVDILDKNPLIARSAKYLIFHPARHSAVLRDYLNKNRYEIIEEKIVYDQGKYCEIIKARDGNQIELTKFQMEFGFIMEKNKDYYNYLSYCQKKLESIIESRKKSEGFLDSKEHEESIEVIEQLRRIKDRN